MYFRHRQTDTDFRPLHNLHPLTDRQKPSLEINQRCILVCKIWCKSAHGGFWANGWNTSNFYLLWVTYHRSDCSTDFHIQWLKWHKIMQGCAFWCFIDTATYSPLPKTLNVRVWVGAFKPSMPNIETFILLKVLHQSWLNFAERQQSIIHVWSN